NLLMAAIEDPDRPNEDQAAQAVSAEVDGLIEVIQKSQADWLVVSNEVGLGLVPPNPLGRLYRDLLGLTNQRLAAQADQVIWMVAGIPVPIHPFRS
ncbi:MAG TPA: bifunctional adenosylcobinamide kinase/adenosylcobinamide-phosphate guanylyltransferase, partial [Anaerolineales bacterium]|nr:bifunctional adenosylcobinamide kinase/adenosylcobinamide-phosphate guanylyltransferase [Anaerolineales bacterium]